MSQWVAPVNGGMFDLGVDRGAAHVRAAVAPVMGRTRVRWSRLLGAAVVLAAVGLALVALAGGVREPARAGSPPVARGDGAVVATADAALQEHVMAPGDTVWQLAESVAPGVDPRETVDRIMRLNGLTDADVEVGRVILLPR